MDLVAWWFVLAAVVGVAASAKGRSGLGWFIRAALLSPLIAGLLVLVLPRATADDPGAPHPDTHVRCPDCRELVRRDARVCKHCGCKLVPQ